MITARVLLRSFLVVCAAVLVPAAAHARPNYIEAFTTYYGIAPDAPN